MKEIKKISENELINILDNCSPSGKYLPLGLFWCKEGEKFIGADNLSGDCWVEEFNTFTELEKWLKDE